MPVEFGQNKLLYVILKSQDEANVNESPSSSLSFLFTVSILVGNTYKQVGGKYNFSNGFLFALSIY